jgi:hypothetical protein
LIVQFGSDAGPVIVGAAAIVRLNVLVPVAPVESVILMVTDGELTVVGVPEMTPVVVFSERPGGRAPAVIAQVYGGVPPEGWSV